MWLAPNLGAGHTGFMGVNRATDAALRVLLALAATIERRASVRDLATELNVPRHHLAKVVQSLAREGWVATSVGRAGGVTITASGLTATAGDVVRTLEGSAPVIDCYALECPLLARGCRLPRLFADAQRAFLATLDDKTIEQLAC